MHALDRDLAYWQPPYPYERWADGIYLTRQDRESADALAAMDENPDAAEPCPVYRRPHVIRIYPGLLRVRSQSDLLGKSTPDVWVELQTDQGIHLYPASTVADARNLPSLAREGLAFHSENARALVMYLAALRLQAPTVLRASRCGHVVLPDGSEGWMLGRRWIGPEGTYLAPPPDRLITRYCRAMDVAGTLQAWQDRYVQLCREAGGVARWLMATAFAAPLLPLIEERSFGVLHYGASGGGKSAILDFGSSIYGRPKRASGKPSMKLTFNATAMSIETQTQFVDALPVTFDELQAATFKDGKAMSRLIYNIVLGVGRSRNNSSGELQEAESEYLTVLRMTGEQPILEQVTGRDMGGQANRLLEIKAAALSSADAAALHQWMEREPNHGTAGVVYLRHLVRVANDPERRQKLRARFDGIHDAIKKELGGSDQRYRMLACVALAQYVSQRLFAFDPDFMTASMLRSEVIRDTVEVATAMQITPEKTPYIVRGVRALQAHRSSEPGSYLDLGHKSEIERLQRKEYRNLCGIYRPNSNELAWFVPQKINRVLRDNEFNPDRFWGDMADAGHLTRYAGRGLTVARKSGEFSAAVYAVRTWPRID